MMECEGVSQNDRDTPFHLYIYASISSSALYFVPTLKADSLLGQPLSQSQRRFPFTLEEAFGVNYPHLIF